MGREEGAILKHKIKVKEERPNQQGDNISQLGIPILWTFEHKATKGSHYQYQLSIQCFELNYYCKVNFS